MAEAALLNLKMNYLWEREYISAGGSLSHTKPVQWCSTDTITEKKENTTYEIVPAHGLPQASPALFTAQLFWLIVQLWICESPTVFPDDVSVTGREKEWNGTKKWERQWLCFEYTLHNTTTV